MPSEQAEQRPPAPAAAGKWSLHLSDGRMESAFFLRPAKLARPRHVSGQRQGWAMWWVRFAPACCGWERAQETARSAQLTGRLERSPQQEMFLSCPGAAAGGSGISRQGQGTPLPPLCNSSEQCPAGPGSCHAGGWSWRVVKQLARPWWGRLGVPLVKDHQQSQVLKVTRTRMKVEPGRCGLSGLSAGLSLAGAGQ